MSVKTVFMFSGQGSQYFQMGRQLFEHDPTFRRVLRQLDALAHARCGVSVVEAIYGSEKSQSFDRTLLTHPAIFMVEYALAQCLIESGIEPDLTLGASMGAFAAAAVGGHLSASDALAAVIAQARAVEATCAPGGMLAVMASEALYQEPWFGQQCTMAGINFDTHFAVAGAPDALATLEAQLKLRGVSSQRLAVSYAFHSAGIEAARSQFCAHPRSHVRRAGALPLACAEQAAVLHGLPDDFFWRSVRQPMRFRDTIARLEQDGPCQYIDVGPSGTLATFVKYGLAGRAGSRVHAVLTPFGRDQHNLASLLTAQQAVAA
jgi:bacillaene synthase trans-acting acyltransferase